MIVEFSVKNFRSVKELQTISFQTAGLKSSDKNQHVDRNNIVQTESGSFFNTIGIYGANASGKSNVIKAIDTFFYAMAAQPSDQSNLKNLCDPFLYQEEPHSEDTYFQIVLLVEGKKFRYGFTVKKDLNPQLPISTEKSYDVITNEWLYGPAEKNSIALFIRKGQKIITNKLPNKKSVPSEIPFAHSIYLKHIAAFDKESICLKILQLLRQSTSTNLDLDLKQYRNISIGYIHRADESSKHEFLRLMSVFNIDYDSIYINDDHDMYKYQDEVMPLEKIFMAKTYLEKGKVGTATLNMEYTESSGTQKLFDLCGLLLRIFRWHEPAILVIDEIDSHFHPALLIKLIGLFNDPSVNRSRSQLLFTSHDTNLMDPSIMRRDQFYFTEKQESNATNLYSLADLRGIRNDANFAKEYLAGFYGALPVLGNYKHEQ